MAAVKETGAPGGAKEQSEATASPPSAGDPAVSAVLALQRSIGNRGVGRLLQRTSVHDVLNQFFSPVSKEKLWVMPATDSYTKLVRRWGPVIEAVDEAKADLAANPEAWASGHRTTPSWAPSMTYEPPATDPNAYDVWVGHPPGTEPGTCASAYFKETVVPSSELSTCAIGSFGIYVTADSVDVAAQTAQLRIVMFNAMSEDSFGKFAPYAVASGMKKQYMWWLWNESYAWGSTPVAPIPEPARPPVPIKPHEGGWLGW